MNLTSVKSLLLSTKQSLLVCIDLKLFYNCFLVCVSHTHKLSQMFRLPSMVAFLTVHYQETPRWSISPTRKHWERLELFSLEEKGINVYKYLMGGSKRTEPGCFHWCSVATQRSMGTSWNTGNSLRRSGKISLLWESPSAARGCPKRLWCLHP